MFSNTRYSIGIYERFSKVQKGGKFEYLNPSRDQNSIVPKNLIWRIGNLKHVTYTHQPVIPISWNANKNK